MFFFVDHHGAGGREAAAVGVKIPGVDFHASGVHHADTTLRGRVQARPLGGQDAQGVERDRQSQAVAQALGGGDPDAQPREGAWPS